MFQDATLKACVFISGTYYILSQVKYNIIFIAGSASGPYEFDMDMIIVMTIEWYSPLLLDLS